MVMNRSKILASIASIGLCTVAGGAIAAQNLVPQSTVPAHIEGNKAVLDWDSYSVSDLQPLPDGRTFGQILTVENFPAIGDLSLSEVVPANTTIGSIDGLDNVSVGQVVDSVPGLSDRKASESPAFEKIVENYAIKSGTKVAMHYADKAIGQVLKDVPGLDKIPLGAFSEVLNGDPLSSLPGLAEIAINKIPGLDKVVLDKIPGLEKLPLSKFMDLAKYSPIAILNDTWSKEEQKSIFKSVSGSDVEGWSVPCNQTNCSYIELGDYRGSLAIMPYHGARWNVGGPNIPSGQQMVKGGHGFLGKLFGGLEPTGRPLGSDVKIVLSEVDQSKGLAKFSLYTHACVKGKGCTPFIIGPFPFLETNETGMVFMGVPDLSKKVKVRMPQSIVDKVKGIVDQYSPPEEGGTQDTSMQDCTQKALSVADPSKASAANSLLPALIKDSLGSGLDANQTAFLVAVADEKYNFNVDSSTLIKQYSAVAKSNVSSKVVNYYAAASSAGVSSDVANKAAEYQTALKPCQNASCSASGKMIRPSSGVVISEEGMRFHPILHVWKLHAGIDLGDGTGDPIRAADCGTVSYVGDEDGYGHVVVIKHGKYFTRSAHLSGQSVHSGQVVKQGQLIGRAGASGRVTGPHLHFEVRDGSNFGTPMNPRQFIGF
jgi:murein DD-endopeptidase MepM/ murein hydrolase activator NlpD